MSSLHYFSNLFFCRACCVYWTGPSGKTMRATLNNGRHWLSLYINVQASNAYLEFRCGTNFKILFELVKEMPKHPDSPLIFDFISEFYSLFFTWIVQQLIPVSTKTWEIFWWKYSWHACLSMLLLKDINSLILFGISSNSLIHITGDFQSSSERLK